MPKQSLNVCVDFNEPHFSQGRLVNIHSFSVNTIASVLKKFLRKIPGGIFGPDGEQGRTRMTVAVISWLITSQAKFKRQTG